MVKILWARHGQNVANLTGAFSYRIFDGDLTELGKRQAKELAERLAAERPAAACPARHRPPQRPRDIAGSGTRR